MLDALKGFGVTFSTMFKKVNTEQYPEEKRPTAPRYHGRHVLNRHPDGLEKCVGCELCAWACPADAIFVEGADNTEEERFSPGERYGRIYQINYLRCIFCGLCIEACPTRALTMSNEYELADDSRRDLIFTKEQLLAPLLPGMEAPPHPMRLGDDEHDYYAGAGAKASPVGGDPGIEGRLQPRRGQGHRAHDAGHDGRGRGMSGVHLLAAAGSTGTGEAVLFWILGPLAFLAAIGLVLSRSAIHGALFLAVDMVCLAAFYAQQDAPFLAFVQVIVYTGAIMMLFLFVLMLLGVDSSDSLVETIRGQRATAVLLGVGIAVLLVAAIGSAFNGTVRSVGLADANSAGNVTGIANLLFSRYIFAFEATSALLITAALGAMVLAHRERLVHRLTQRDLMQRRFRPGGRPSPLPGPGVYANHDAVDTPALLPDGTAAPGSVSEVLEISGARPRVGEVERELER